ncbi:MULTISPECIES: motility associated factor glycosyltransferase family protein [unclassified Lysinibacillus]|uniref:motility associated factor glycosyltransferase family protein n=1 Tax=unclassified Lysinibacillus TaxID=2636778 RepID=UPI00131EDE2A|nr:MULTISPECIES: 6-hydroxymethylpterin diphosphokinase MptE-like protein [unclassified Lysinibacillus]
MILVNNRILLRNINPNTYKKIVALESIEQRLAKIVPSKRGVATLYVERDGNNNYVHSKYDPLREIPSIYNGIKDLSNYEHILFIGTGLGYHIVDVLEKYPHIKISIYEMDLEILETFLATQDLSKFKQERFKEIFTIPTDIQDMEKFFDRYTRKSIDVILPFTNTFYKEEINDFSEKVVTNLKKKKDSLGTNAAFQQRWIINSIINAPKVMTTPNILLSENNADFAGKPVILVSAGPSLSFDLEVIRRIKEEGRAYVFAVGSAVNALITANIMPDAFFTYDPTEANQIVAKAIKDNKFNIPIVFGSSVGFETLHNYPGKMVHFITSQDTLAEHLLKPPSEIVVSDSPSVAVMTLQILFKLKMQPIILAGQNLGYLNDTFYAEEIKYVNMENKISERQIKDAIKVKDVYGNEMLTNESYLSMKETLEIFIRKNPHIPVINTTKKGAYIEGTNFEELESVLETKLKNQNVVQQLFGKLESEYSMEATKENYKILEDSFDVMWENLQRVLEKIEVIQNTHKLGMYKNIQKQLVDFDLEFRQVKYTLFYDTIIIPIVRVQHEQFVKRSIEVQATSSLQKKTELFIEIFGSFVKTILAAVVYVQPAFQELKKSEIFNEKDNG